MTHPGESDTYAFFVPPPARSRVNFVEPDAIDDVDLGDGPPTDLNGAIINYQAGDPDNPITPVPDDVPDHLRSLYGYATRSGHHRDFLLTPPEIIDVTNRPPIDGVPVARTPDDSDDEPGDDSDGEAGEDELPPALRREEPIVAVRKRRRFPFRR